jgi:hypothetical protein
MIFLDNLKSAIEYIEDINNRYTPTDQKTFLTKIQKKFLAFCITGIIVSGCLSWEGISRASGGRWSAKALSKMMKTSKIKWEKLLELSTLVLIKIFNIMNGTIVFDDSIRERCKKTKKIFGSHKTRNKKGGFSNAQEIVFILLVTRLITIPIGFKFYRPDPAIKAWTKNDKRLRKKGIPKSRRPKRPEYSKDYPPKKKIAMQLLRQFKYRFGKIIKVYAIL